MRKTVVLASLLVVGFLLLAGSRHSVAESTKVLSPVPAPIVMVLATVQTIEPVTEPEPVVRLTIPPAQNTKLAQQRFARLSVNEHSGALRNGGVPTPDNLGVLQTALAFQEWRSRGRKRPMTVQDALGALAPCMAGLKPCKPTTRQRRWTRNLPMTGLAQPEGWEPRDGTWSQYAENWSKYRDAVTVIFAEGFEPPCQGVPIAWGNAGDDHIAISRGLCKLDCGDTRNWFWGFPKDNLDVPCEIRTEPREPRPTRVASGGTISAASQRLTTTRTQEHDREQRSQ